MHCASCGHPTPADARFCPRCGSSCAPTAPPEERRVVTVVFCDLVGSTALSGALDPETLRAVTLDYFEAVRGCVEDFGGTVEKFIGDAVMAVFGIPVIHEDDARRALGAALAMLAAVEELNTGLNASLGVRLQVRIGVNTGPVVTSSDVSTRQKLVSGETVNVAARLEQNAGRGEILVGEPTLLAAGSAARVAPVGPLRVKGKEDPVTAHRLLAVEEDDPERLRRFDVPYVGRARERAELGLALDGVAADESAQLVTLYGEAGVGKTRLLREWHAGLDTPVAFGAGRCRPYGDHGSLAPLAEAVRQLLDGPMSPACTAERAEVRGATAVLEAGLLRDGTPSPSVEDTCSALVALLAALARARPVVLVIDDCHWAGELLMDVLDRLVEELDLSAVLLLCAARLDLLDRRPGWGSGRPRSRSLMLSGLPPEESEALAAVLTEVSAHRSAVPARAVEAAGGNPFYLEQLIATADGPGPDGDASLPPSLQALLAARVDALERPERAVLDLASVLGRDFTADELGALAAAEGAEPGREAREVRPEGTAAADDGSVRPALTRLSRRRLVQPLRRPAAEDRPYRFSSGLVQEVTYRSLAKRARARHHEQAAALLTARRAGDARVADHLRHAYRYRVELGLRDEHTETLRHRAAELLTRSGALALARADLARAGVLLQGALDLLTEGEDGWTRAALPLAEVRLATGRSEEGLDLLRAVPDRGCAPVEAAHARLALAVATAPPGEVVAAAEETLPVFESAGDHLGQTRARVRIAQELQLQGRHGRADGQLTRALRHAELTRAEPERAVVLGAIGISLWRGPEPVDTAVARCRDLLAAHGGPRPTVRLTLGCPLAVLLALGEDWSGARSCLDDVRRLAEGLHYAESSVVVPLFAASVESLAGRPLEAAALFARAAAAARRLGADALLGAARRESARLLLDGGDAPGAAGHLPSERAGGTTGPLPRADAADLDGLRARLAVAAGRSGEAARLAERARAAAEETDSPVVRATAALDAALVFGELGDWARAAHAAGRARALFRAKGHLPGARRAEELRARAAARGAEVAR
ncbi:AAA family ATPase [Streptomyces chumphonensis]|uniref:AAA family ATPase n=1 Tax=Streptomyces chumphonensis TaxID=1214925 RepID=A0A927IC83_9ACTN|nr:adenylate/guanylate cyclase domain-containing protein [Streptomyces chumphonensis]MBD3931787.1 AAA family ATPase [Streptomyces chumphonensis]